MTDKKIVVDPKPEPHPKETDYALTRHYAMTDKSLIERVRERIAENIWRVALDAYKDGTYMEPDTGARVEKQQGLHEYVEGMDRARDIAKALTLPDLAAEEQALRECAEVMGVIMAEFEGNPYGVRISGDDWNKARAALSRLK